MSWNARDTRFPYLRVAENEKILDSDMHSQREGMTETTLRGKVITAPGMLQDPYTHACLVLERQAQVSSAISKKLVVRLSPQSASASKISSFFVL